MIAWVTTPQGEGALVGFARGSRPGAIHAIVLINKRFEPFPLGLIEWLRWPE